LYREPSIRKHHLLRYFSLVPFPWPTTDNGTSGSMVSQASHTSASSDRAASASAVSCRGTPMLGFHAWSRDASLLAQASVWHWNLQWASESVFDMP